MKTHSSPALSIFNRVLRRLIGVVVLLLSGIASLSAQQDLETAVPANWTANNGGLSISGNHYKMGSQSLRWEWNAGDVITIDSPGINAADVTNFYKHTCDFWVWNGAAQPGSKLRVEFMNGSTAQYWFDFYLDYTGWRQAVRSYLYDMGKKTSPSSTFTSVRIIAPATGSGSFHLDAIRWVGDRFTRNRDAQNPDIAGYYSSTGYSDFFAAIPDLPADPPTAAELTELATARSRWLTAIKGGVPSASSVTSAGNSFAAMNIVDDATNGIRGQVVGESPTSIDGWVLTLARDYAHGTATATASRDKMLLLARHLLDQGHATNSNSVPGAWYDNMNLSNALALMGPAYDPATKAKMWDFFRWNYRLGRYWSTDWERNTDDIYCGITQTLGAILFLTPDDTEAVRQLKGLKRHLERFVVPSEGSEDGVKPDGLSFHHRSHYNGYMYAWNPLVDSLYYLRGTGYQVNLATYQSLRTAMLTMMRMSADGTSTGTDVGYYGHSLVGRNAFAMNLNMNRDTLRRLGEWGGMIEGQSADVMVARAYNRRFGLTGSNSYSLFTPYGSEDPPDGFLQFNYSPLGVYRRANWVASIRAPQRYFWSSEIFETTNRYGRYQSYGALEILYHGGKEMCGEQLAGWDWNHMPGTTTIALPDSKLVAINDREDVRSQINFSGALAFHDGQSGLYAGNFQEKAADTNHNPSFVWRKSWFAFGNEIVCLGSDIANNDAANPTATTLFQGKLATQSTAITLDGNAITGFPHASTTSGSSAHWLLDAYGTGYLVQPGANVKITRSTQSSANQSGSGAPTTADFAKAWLDHGTAPNGAAYEYAVLPGTDATAMATAASQHASASTKPYEVLQRDSGAHVVKWKADGKIGYSVFNAGALPAATANAGLLTAVERPCLVMTQYGSNDDARLSVVDPDLNFSNPQASYGLPDASVARTLDLTVNGSWSLDAPAPGTSIVSVTTTNTVIRVTTQHGFAIHLHLLHNGTPGQEVWANLGSDWSNPVNWGGALPVNDINSDVAVFGAATVQPVLNCSYSLKGISVGGGTTLSGTGNLSLGASGIVSTGSTNSVSLSNITLAANQNWDVSTGTLTVSSAIGGPTTARLTKTGAGILALSGANSYLGGTTMSGGTLQISGDQSAANGGWAINLPGNGTATTVNFQSGSSVAIASGKTVTFQNSSNAAHTLNVAGAVTNNGTLLLQALSNLNLNSGGAWTQAGTMTLKPNSSFASATMTVNTGATFNYTGSSAIVLANSSGSNGGNGTLALNGGLFTTSAGFNNDSSGTAGTANLTFSNGGTLKLSTNIATLATVTGSGNRPFNVQIGTGGGKIDSNGFSTTLALGIANLSGQTGSLVKQGNGTLTLSAPNSYSGPTTIEGGTLTITGSLGNGVVTASNNATLAGNGSIGGAVTVQAGGSLAPSGTLTVNNTLSLAGSAQMELGKTGSVLSGDKVTGLSTVTYGGNLVITHLGPDPLAAGDSFQLFAATSYSSSFNNVTLPPLATGLLWDSSKLSANGTIAVRGLPVAIGDSATVAEDGSATIAVLANDSDADSDPLVIQSVTQGAHGTVTITGNQVTYIPAANWNGNDSFNYTITDNREGTATASVAVSVSPVNDGPAFAPLANANATEDMAFTGNIASAASDIDTGDTLTFSKVSGPIWLTVAPSGALSGTPANAEVGSNNFVLRVTDAAGASADRSFSITVANVNDTPVFTITPIAGPAGNEGQAYNASITGSAVDVDAVDTLVYSKVSGPAWLNVAEDGSLFGVPGSGDTGTNAFVVRATDQAGAFAESPLTISIATLGNNGIWTNTNGGSWNTTTNWSGGVIASGANRSADFSTLNLTANATVTLNGTRTLGSLIFGDTTPSHGWTLTAGSGGPLRLEVSSGSPVITVTNSSATLSVAVAGSQGLTKAGPGSLTLSGSNSYTGPTTVNAGTLSLTNRLLDDAGTVTIASGATLDLNFSSSDQIAALVINGTSLPAGTYSSKTHPGILTGPGRLKVGTIAAVLPPDLDSDQDGLSDWLEFVFGTDAHAPDSANVVTQKISENLIVTFHRDDLSEEVGLGLTVEAGSSLGTWPQVFQIGDSTTTSSPGVTVEENGDQPDTITVTIPTNGAAACFARVKVVAGG